MAKSSPGSSFYPFSALGRTYDPGSSFWPFSTNGRTYSQKQPQEAYFDNFRPLAAQVAKSSSRKLLTSNTAREICVKLNTAWEIVLKLNTTWKIELAPKKQWGWNKQHPATQQHVSLIVKAQGTFSIKCQHNDVFFGEEIHLTVVDERYSVVDCR